MSKWIICTACRHEHIGETCCAGVGRKRLCGCRAASVEIHYCQGGTCGLSPCEHTKVHEDLGPSRPAKVTRRE
jgi:hypothetical protein